MSGSHMLSTNILPHIHEIPGLHMDMHDKYNYMKTIKELEQ